MIFETGSDVDFVSALLHGRRARLAEAERLDALCAIRTIPELVHAIEPNAPNEPASALKGYGRPTIALQGGGWSVIDLQRRMVLKLADELLTLAWRIAGPAGSFLEWMAVRFQVENLKVLARGMVRGAKLKEVEPYLVPLRKPFALDAEALVTADSLEMFAARIPSTPLQSSVRLAAAAFERNRRSFFIEAALDHGYLTELLARAGVMGATASLAGRAPLRAARVGKQPVAPGSPLAARELPDVLVLALQEADMFHLDLAARGRLTYDLRPEDLVAFYVPGAGIRRSAFAAMLSAHDAQQMAAEAAGRAIDRASAAQAKAGEAGEAVTPAVLETLALNRYYRLAYWIFRRSHIGVGVIAGYAAMRRVELANLITLSEGIRAGVAPAVLRRRLIPRRAEEHESV